MFKLYFIFLIAVACSGPVIAFEVDQPSPEIGGLANETKVFYGPEIVTLEGKLSVETFPGPPEYSSVKKGDKPEKYWILILDPPPQS